MNANDNPWDRFTHKAALFFSGYPERAPGLKRELARVGVENYTPFWSSRNPYDPLLISAIPKIRKDCCIAGYFNSTMKHYAATKAAYELGAESLLVFEDDVRFLKDTDPVFAAVRSLPDDYDAALFEWTPMSKADDPGIREDVAEVRSRPVNEHWCRATKFYSMAAYALSRRMMEKLIDRYESPAFGLTKLRIGDHYWKIIFTENPDMKAYLSLKNVCIQASPTGNTSMDSMRSKYASMDIDLSKYAEW